MASCLISESPFQRRSLQLDDRDLSKSINMCYVLYKDNGIRN